MHFDCNQPSVANLFLIMSFVHGNTGLNLTIVILAVAAVVAGEEGIGEVRALTAGPDTL